MVQMYYSAALKTDGKSAASGLLKIHQKTKYQIVFLALEVEAENAPI